MTTHHKEPNRFENKLTRYFDDFLNDVGLTRAHGGGIKLRGTGGTDGKQSTWTPAIDIKENDREYVVIADVPGVSKEDLDVELHDTLLVISGQNKQDPHNTAYSQQIGIDKDNQGTQYTGNQQSTGPQQTTGPQYQQTTGPQYNQQSNGPQYNQQSNGPQKQTTGTQYQQQSTGQPQPTGQQTQIGQQQPTEPIQYKDRKDKQPEYQQDSSKPYYPSQPGEQQYYQQQSNEQRYQQQPDEQRYQQQPDEQRYQQQPDERRYQQQAEQQYQQPGETQQYQRLSKHRQKTQGERIHIQERPYGYFSRSIQLPNNIKADDDFHANLSNGVLKVRIPKSNDRPKKKITIS